MRPALSLHPRALALAASLTLNACSPGSSGSATDADADATATTTTTTTADATECGAPPPSPMCDPAAELDPREEVCAARSAESCDGPIDPDGGVDSCAWVTARRFAYEATDCAESSEQGLCVALEYLGDGCGEQFTCGGDVAGQVYARVTPSCDVDVFLGSFCGERPIGWLPCAWGQVDGEACEPPFPDEGPAVCSCACADGAR